MTGRALCAAAHALFFIIPVSVHAEDRHLQTLAAALTRLEAQGSGAVEVFAPDTGADDTTLGLAPFVETFVQRDAEQRHAFDIAAAKGLGGKAAERLAAARRAWANGQGRLVWILQRLAVAPSGKRPIDQSLRATKRIDLIQEARLIVEKLQDASRNDPISAGELKIRAPRIQAPPLVVGEGKRPDRTALAPEATAERTATVPGVDDVPIGYVPGVLQDAAAAFSGPIEVYEFVRNNVRPEFYHGGMKGALQTYLEGSGNDADTAAVLIALLRAKGFPARFVRGTVEIPASTLTAVTGTVSVEEAVRVLERAAIPHETVLGAGKVSSIKLERVWAEAYLPYVNYRGAVLDSQGKCWVPLDAGFKRLEPVSGIDIVRDLGFDPRAVMDEYLASSDTRRPLELVKAKVTALLAQQQPDKTYNDALNSRGIVPETLGALPASLPYPVVDRTEVTYALPETLQHSVRFIGEANGTTLLDATFPVSDLLGRRLTLSYVPDSAEDQELVTSYGGLYWTPPYLIDVRPVLKSGGVAIATGATPVGMGVKYALRMEFKTAGGTETVENTVLAGNMLAIGLGGRQVTGTETETDTAAAILSARAWGYLDRWNRSDEELADLFRVVPVRPTVSECMTMSDIEVEYAGGDPLYPIRYEWKGIAIDADLRSTAPVGLSSRDSERPFVLISGLEGSVLENKIFEEDLQIASVSTAKALQLAKAHGIEILDLNQGNVDSVLPGLPLDSAVKTEIRDATSRGFLARVPAANATYMAWTGVGYLLLDEETGEAAYQLQGGHSGGVTAPSVLQIPTNVVDDLKGQKEEPTSEGSEVAKIQKFPSTDYQFGFVDTSQDLQRIDLKPLKVLVTDVKGHPVPKAEVTFGVIGGGGLLVTVDPTTKARTEASTIAVRSNEKGIAEVTLKLGKKTDLIPRYITLAGDDYSTQVGLNMVSAIAGAAVLPEPIFAFGFPEDTIDGHVGWARFRLTEHSRWYAWANLRFAGRFTVSAEDKHGNPLANVNTAFHALHPPTEAPVPDGWMRLRDVKTDTPRSMAELVGAWDFEKCRQDDPNPKWGTCEGRTQTITAKTTSVGTASAYPFLGESPDSRYHFEIDAGLTPGMFKDYFSTAGYICEPAPSCANDYWRPFDPIVTAESRLVLLNRLGNPIEAYPPEKDGELSFSADVLWEKDRIEVSEGRYYAKGTNEWVREDLTDSLFELTPTTPGTTVSPTVAEYNGTAYVSKMTMSPTPQLNTLDWKSTHQPNLIKYKMDGGYAEVAAEDVDMVEMIAKRAPDPARPVIVGANFALWGVKPAITALEPSPIPLGATKAVSSETRVSFSILPTEYAELMDPLRTRFDLKRQGKAVLTAYGGGGSFVIAKGTGGLEAGPYQGSLTLEQVTEGGKDLVSDPFAVTAAFECPSLLTWVSRVVELKAVRDPLNGTLCAKPGHIGIELCRPAKLTLTLDGAPLQNAELDGVPSNLTDVPLEAGVHVVTVPVTALDGVVGSQKNYQVHAESIDEPIEKRDETGVLRGDLLNCSVLPVGHTFVKGVDLYDGHVVRQASDLKLPGRHLGLDVTRTYSSAGRSSDGVMGGGWSLNYAAQITPTSCNQYVVRTADGSSQVFRTYDGGATFTPQKGYHTKLQRRNDDVFIFTDKSGTKHYFRERVDPSDEESPIRLDYIEDPHGDRVALAYDTLGHVTTVSEVHKEDYATPVRQFRFTYEKIADYYRVVLAEAIGLGLKVEYQYDNGRTDGYGNLTRVKKHASNPDGREALDLVEQYEYDLDNWFDRHQLTSVVDVNGHRTEYVYHQNADPFPGQTGGNTAPGLLIVGKWEYAKTVREFPAAVGAAEPYETRFGFDYTRAASEGTVETTVTDARDVRTAYLLNANGSPLKITEAIGRSEQRTTEMEWATNDIYKVREKDASSRATRYAYDSRGNLTGETVETTDYGEVTTAYAYDGTFNKLTWKQDARGPGYETNHVINATTGDLEQTTDAEGNQTLFQYDEYGKLIASRDPRKNSTAYSDHDAFGNARRIDRPLGHTTIRGYDARGRLTREVDQIGGATLHETVKEYDGLDRVRRVVRRALDSTSPPGGETSDDDITVAEYYPGGQPKRLINANGATTEFELDGLDRVIRQTVSVPGTLAGTQHLTTEFRYDGNGNKTFEKDPMGVERAFSYDGLNRLVKVEITGGPGSGPSGEIATYGYDHVGNKLFETNVGGLRTDYEYDGLYRVNAKLAPETMSEGFAPAGRLTERYSYDAVGNRLSVTDPNGHTATFAYDKLNRLTYSDNAVGHSVTVTYADPEGSKVNKAEDLAQPQGLKTTYRYDQLNRATERTQHLTGAGGAGQTYVTQTQYLDAEHAVLVTGPDPEKRQVKHVLNGLDREILTVVDPGALDLTTATAYDGLGNKKQIVDPLEHVTAWDYDGIGRLVRVVDAKNQSAVFDYDPNGNKRYESDRRGVSKLYEYDRLNRLTKTTLQPSISGVEWTQEIVRDDRGRVTTVTDARGKQTVAHLDGLDREVRIEEIFLGQTLRQKRQVFDGINKREESDWRGNVSKYEYDPINRMTKVTDPLSLSYPLQFATTDYLDSANQRREVDRRGVAKVTQFDPLGRVLSVTRVGTRLELNEYDGDGNKTRATDAEERITRFEYDNANRLTSRTDGFGKSDASTIQWMYDADGNRIKEIDARSSVDEPSATFGYDELHRMTSQTDGMNNTTSFGYDAEGNRILLTEPLGQRTVFAYDELGKLTSVRRQDGTETNYKYDRNRNRVRQIDALGHAVAMDYDGLNRMTSMTQDPGGLNLVTLHAYDENGNETTLTDAKKQIIRSEYDELNRLAGRSYEFASGDPVRPWRYTSGIEYAYDPNSNLTTTQETEVDATDPTTPVILTTRREYDDLDRPTQETTTPPGGGSRIVGYSYYGNGLRKTVTDPENGITSYAYDWQNRLKTVTTVAGDTSFGYYPDDLLQTVTYPSGVTATHTYDNADRLKVLSNAKETTVATEFTYAYDQNGNRLSQVEVNGGKTENTDYAYDDLNRLKTITYPIDTTYAQGRKVTYVYDAVGNRAKEITTLPDGSETLDSKTGYFDTINRLFKLADDLDGTKTITFGYDANGNQTQKTENGQITNYSYDVRDKLVEVTQGPSTLARYQYDFEGRRTLKIGLEGPINYVYDQQSVFAEYAYNTAWYRVAKYDYGSDRLISMDRFGEGRRYYSFDGLRSVVNLTGDDGAVTASYHLDAWGNYRFPDELASSQNRFGFTGYMWDAETNLYNAKARYFDPKIGRFISQDSYLGKIEDPPSLHRYFYGYANPTRYWDPTGHDSELAKLSQAEKARRAQQAASGQGRGGAYTTNQGGQVVRDEGSAAANRPKIRDIPDRTVADEKMLAEEVARLKERERNRPKVVQEEVPADRPTLADRALQGAEDAWNYLPGKARELAQEHGTNVARDAFGANKPRGSLTPEDLEWQARYPGMRAQDRLEKVPESMAEHTGLGLGATAEAAAEAAQGKALQEAGKVLDEAADARRAAKASESAAPTVTRRIPRDKLKYRPPERGRAPIGADDKPVELHHTDQGLGNASPRAEMTKTEHRGGGNYSGNHPNTGQKPSTVDRVESSRQHRTHWENEWDAGEFDKLPEQKK